MSRSTKRVDIKILQEEALKRGGKLISQEYKNNKTAVEWECKFGHRWFAKWDHVKRGHWCQHCASTKKLDIRLLQEHAVKNGGRLLSTEYKNNQKNLLWECCKGHKWEAPWTSIGRGTWCPYCYGNVRKSKEEVAKYVKLKGGELLSREYKNKREKLEIKCSKGHIFRMSFGHIKNCDQWCPQCCMENTSAAEREIANYIEFLGFKVIPKYHPDFLNRKEIDIFIPDKNLGIEYHGLAWHSERNLFQSRAIESIKKGNEFKYIQCKLNSVKLIQIFEDEWRDKREICKSIIRNKLGISSKKIYARNTEVQLINVEDSYKFFEHNHIGGKAQAKVAFGLFYNSELVSCLSLRPPFTKKNKGFIEIARFASKLNTQVVGGFQKLLAKVEEWAKVNGYQCILTYADCRFGSGEVYKLAGFKYRNKTAPNYFYEKSGKREGRFKHKKNNKITYIQQHGNTEKEQNNSQGWFAIYDAGSEVYVKTLISDGLKTD